MDIRQEARQHLETYGTLHVECCGTPLIRRMLSAMDLHAGDCLSLDNEVNLMREHLEESQTHRRALEKENGNLRAAFRINMMRLGQSEDEIQRVLLEVMK